jgi:hypothetical protein
MPVHRQDLFSDATVSGRCAHRSSGQSGIAVWLIRLVGSIRAERLPVRLLASSVRMETAILERTASRPPLSLLFVLTATLVSQAVVAPACSGKSSSCEDAPCGSQTAYPVGLYISCGNVGIVQAILSGTCAEVGFTCQVPAGAPIDQCTQASFNATGPGECDAQLSFANGFVYSGHFTFVPPAQTRFSTGLAA